MPLGATSVARLFSVNVVKLRIRPWN